VALLRSGSKVRAAINEVPLWVTITALEIDEPRREDQEPKETGGNPSYRRPSEFEVTAIRHRDSQPEIAKLLES
jgi:hypothetical protein